MKKQNKFPIISENEYLAHILDSIPTHTILFKTLTGIGATTLEIECLTRNSIIIEPNQPVIYGKSRKYNPTAVKKVLGVYEGVRVDNIIDYLESNVFPKKIITTPESYPKVKQAMEETGIDLFQNYFMLFDECERTIQDVSYRANILLPIDDFFQFKNKAFISATPIIPSDPRFEKQGFKHIHIQPDYDFRENLKLITTNNVFFTLKKHITDNPRDQYFIFLNSTDTIARLISYLEIKSDSAVFCAKESMQKLKVNNYTHAYTALGAFRKYNFLTSRFFSAVDIYNIDNPSIIMITDLVSAEHSMIDPASEAVQIAGRFRTPRNAQVTKEITHITNLNAGLKSKTMSQVLEYVNVWHRVYSVLKRFFNAATRLGVREVLQEMIKRAEFSKYINFDGSKNYFMQDNTIHEEKVKGYYQSRENLEKAYSESKHFNLEVLNEEYEFSDFHNAKVLGFAPLKTVFEVIMPIIKDLHEPDKYSIFHTYFQMEYLRKEFPEPVHAFNIIGLDTARDLDFNPRKIRKAVREKELQIEQSNFGFIAFIEKEFIEGKAYSSKAIYSITQRGLNENKLSLLNPGVKLLKKYCELSKRMWIGTDANGNDILGYRILKVYNKLKK